MARPFERSDENLVGQNIQLLLDFTLDIFSTDDIEVSGQCASVYLMANGLTGGSNVTQ